MGLSFHSARFLLDAKRTGCDFGDVLTIGHQEMIISETGLSKLAAEFGLAAPSQDLKQDTYAGTFFREMLGVTSVSSLDASAYEGADILHNLNDPIPEDLEGSFDTLLDGGTLEHVFNVPVAIANYMRLVKKGGNIFIITPANNYFGHGFYQFSSEFFYRVFSEENGFTLKRLILSEHNPNTLRTSEAGRRYDTIDPDLVGDRTTFVNDMPVEIILHARRTGDQEIFADFPKQSDYARRWDKAGEGSEKPAVSRTSDSPLKQLKRTLRRRRKSAQRSLRNAKHFPPIS